MEAIEEVPIIKKKGRRKKIVDSSEILIYNIDSSLASNNTDILTTVYKKKTKGAKIIDTLLPLNTNVVQMNNIILLLKCSIRDIDEYIKQNLLTLHFLVLQLIYKLQLKIQNSVLIIVII